MRTIGKLTLALGLVAALGLASSAKAQQGGRRGMGMGMGMGGSGLMALMSPDGQKELNLTEDQIEKVRGVMENLRTTMQEKFQGFQDLAPEERQTKAQEVMKEVNAGVEKEIKEILKEDQFKRYRQISLQAMGAGAFADEEVAKKLQLTDDQKAKVKEILDGAQKERNTLMEEARQGGNPQETFGKMREIGVKAKDDAIAVLTDEQKEQWKELTGKEFRFQMGPPGAGGGPGRRRID